MIPKSRKHAKEVGAKEYFTGKPCLNGNIDLRRSSTGQCLCLECTQSRRDACKRHYHENKDYYDRKYSQYYKENSESLKAKRRERGLTNRLSERAYQKSYYWRNREKCISASVEYSKKNAEKVNALQAKRRGRFNLCTPAWADKKAIESIYGHASLLNCWPGPRAQVDHIVPLVSDKVCGLHCESNLQILWQSENAKKGNRYWPDMPEENNARL